MKFRKHQWPQSSAGFTLIELLVIVVIIGILGSISAPGWLSYLNRQRINSVRSELKAVLQQAQTNAQQKSTSYSVVMGTSNNEPTAALSTAGSTATPVVLGENNSNVELSAFIGTSATSDLLTFDYRGGVSEDILPFVIKVIADDNGATQKCLIVTSLLGGIVEADGTTCDNPNLGT